jgi:glycosyltransferase involved in cell wall biosynthesis
MLAIVIPYYKLSFFEATLESLRNQTDKRFTVYIGNDASEDHPEAIIQRYENQLNIVYKKFETNFGSKSLVQQWNRCLDLVQQEEWIVILGDDDVFDENVVASFYKNRPEIEETGNVVRFATRTINENGATTSEIITHQQKETSVDFLFRNSRSSLSEYVFRKKQLKAIGFKDFPLAWFSDVLAVLEFSDFNTVYSINEAIVYVRISSLSISGIQNNFKAKSKAAFAFYYYLLSQKKKHFTPQQFKSLLNSLSKSYLNDKKNGMNFLRISKIYLTHFYITAYFGFLGKIINRVIK